MFDDPGYTVTCFCGFEIKRRESLLEKEGKATCAGCGAMFGAENKDGEWKFFRLFQNFTCPACSERNNFPANKLYDGVELKCKKCAVNVKVEKEWRVRLL